MNKFIKIFTMFFLITFSSTLYADAPGPVNLSLKGIVDWVRFFQFVEYGTALPSTPSTRGVWFILWVNNEPALYWSNGSEWIPFVTAGVQDGSVDTDALADGAVTTPKLADSSVSTNKIVNYAVTTNKIADNAVTGTKFANNSITTAKLAPYAVTNEKLGYLSVGTLNLQNGAVTSDKMESTISDKNIVLNNGTVLNPSLSFHSDRFSGLSYDSASSTIDVSIGASDKIKIGSSFVNFNGLSDGISVSSASERIVLQSNGLHHDDISLVFNNDILASGSLLPSENLTFNLGSSDNKWNNLYSDNIFSENVTVTDSQIDNLRINDGTIYPLTDNTVEIGTDSFRFKSGNFHELKSDNILISNASFTNIESDYILTDNASVTYALTSPKITSEYIVASETVFDNINLASSTSKILPLSNMTGMIGSGDKRFAVINSNVIDSYMIQLRSNNTQNAVVLSADRINVDGTEKDVLLSENSLLPFYNNLNLGSEDNKWNKFYTNNASITQTITVANLIASETVQSDSLSSNNASFTNLSIDNLSGKTNEYVISTNLVPETDNTGYIGSDSLKWNEINSYNINSDNASLSSIISNNLEVKGIASVTSLLVNGAPLSGAENLKFPRGTLSVDVDCGKYSLRSLGKDLVLFSDAFMMIDYNITDDGNYFTFKSGNASPAVMIMDSEIASLTSLTIRLDYENIMSENSESILFELENSYANHIITLYALNKKLYLRIGNINELMDFNYDGYDWSEEHNIYLTVSIDNNNIYYGLNIDGVEVYQNSNSITFTQFDIARVKIGAGYGSGGSYTISKDYNAKYRRIQIYPYVLSLKEKISIPLFQPVADQQRELSKNMTKCPYYTLGEPSTLIGGDFNEGEGFFGEVSGDKFIYGWEVLGQLWGMDMNVIDTKAKFIASFTEVFGSSISYTFTGDSYTELGVSDNLEVEWLKFYDNGYLIFIPKRPLLNNITWNEINNALANCAVGKEIKIDLRRMNPLINSTYSNGNLISVRCRLMTGGNIQPFIYGNVNERGVKDNALCMGSEWNRLMYRICDQIPSDTFAGVMQGYSGGKQLGDNWYNYTGSILGFGAGNDLGRVTWCREYCWYQNTLYCCGRGHEPGVGFVSYTAPFYRGTGYGFRPALVLKVSNQ